MHCITDSLRCQQATFTDTEALKSPWGGGCRSCSTSFCRCANSLRIKSALLFPPELADEPSLDKGFLNFGTQTGRFVGGPPKVLAPAQKVALHVQEGPGRARVPDALTRQAWPPAHCNLSLQNRFVSCGELVARMPAVYIVTE